MPEESKDSGLKRALMVLVTTVAVLLVVVVIGFGLLVGFCALSAKR